MTSLTAADVDAAPSAVRIVWNSPLGRGATAALFLSGLGTSAAAPQITLFLVDDLHVSLTTAGLYYLTNITAPVAGYLIGARSDRTGRRLGFFRLCAIAGFVGWGPARSGSTGPFVNVSVYNNVNAYHIWRHGSGSR